MQTNPHPQLIFNFTDIVIDLIFTYNITYNFDFIEMLKILQNFYCITNQ